MNPNQLLAHFDRISDAPEAIPRLRQFILDLAVRGKLVEQDPNDEPASGVLANLKSHLRTLNEDGRPVRRVAIVRDDCSIASQLFPKTWLLTNFDEVNAIISGVAKGKDLRGMNTATYPYLRVANVQRGYLDLRLVKLLEIRVEDFDRYRLSAGDVLITEGGDWDKLGRAAIWKDEVPDCIHQNHIYRIRSANKDLLLPQWIALFANSQVGRVYFENASKQTTNLASINMTQLRNCPLPLPPTTEQRRIVAKVDELMALCDRLEVAQAERESRRDRLTAASLQRLNQPADPDDFRAHACFHLQHLPRLTSRPEHVQQLRQTILNLAVRGKLVPQDPNDEPATELLRRIQAEKLRLVKSGVVKCLQPVSAVEPRGSQFALPLGWIWVRISDLLLGDSQNGYSKKPDDALNGIPILRISAGTVRKDGIVAEEEYKLISGVTPAQREQYQLQPGDLLACRFNGNRSFVGRLSLYLGYLGINPIYPDKLIRLRILSQFVLPRIVQCFAESSYIRRDIESYCATTVGNWGISASNLKSVQIPLPPLAEQQRIVAKVDELIALCDRLESELSTAQSESRRLLEALLNAVRIPSENRNGGIDEY